jgi:DNA-binding LacI/PurR family transcriptional regulator
MSRSEGNLQTEGAPRRAGLVAVARALGISPTTVSNAYNRPDQLSAALRERVLRKATELGYAGPDPLARGLRTGRAGAVGVVFHDRVAYAFDDPAAVLFLQGFTGATDAEGLAVVLVPGLRGSPAKRSAVHGAAVDGFVLHGVLEDDPLVAATAERRLPTVAVDAPAVPGLDFIGIDDRRAAATAVRHLLELGHRDLGVIALHIPPRVDSVARRRRDGSLEAAAAAGIAPDCVALQESVHSSVAGGRAAAHALLDRAQPSALFAFSDPLALGARLAARERGLLVPGDLSIVGFDGTAPESEGLTSVHQPQREKGRLAAERLARALAGNGDRRPRQELLPTRLVLRSSTGPPAAY